MIDFSNPSHPANRGFSRLGEVAVLPDLANPNYQTVVVHDQFRSGVRYVGIEKQRFDGTSWQSMAIVRVAVAEVPDLIEALRADSTSGQAEQLADDGPVKGRGY